MQGGAHTDYKADLSCPGLLANMPTTPPYTQASMRSQHLVPGKRKYSDRTYAWLLADVQRVAGIPIARKRGSVDWQTGPE